MGQVFGCVRVKQSKVAVREHFGKFDGVLQPGCHCLPWCFGYEVAGELSLRVQQIWLKSEAKTKVIFTFLTYIPLIMCFELQIDLAIYLWFFRIMCLSM